MINNDHLENIVDGIEPIALILKAGFDTAGIRFFTPDSFSQQLAYMTHPKGKTVEPHVHNLIPRQVLYTQEVLYIKRGRVEVKLYSSRKEYLTSRILETGDLILLCGGGHSLEMLEETSMIEIKQGPYAGIDDKIRFEPKV